MPIHEYNTLSDNVMNKRCGQSVNISKKSRYPLYPIIAIKGIKTGRNRDLILSIPNRIRPIPDNKN